VARDGAVPLYFQVASGNVVDDKTTIPTWDLLFAWRRPDFLYVADCQRLGKTGLIHQHQGRFLTCPPNSIRGQSLPELLAKGQVQWRHIHDKRNDKGEMWTATSVSEPAMLSTKELLVWYHSTRKAEQDAHARHSKSSRP